MMERFIVEVVVEAGEDQLSSVQSYVRRRLNGSLQYLAPDASAALLFRDAPGDPVSDTYIKGTPSSEMRDVIEQITDDAA